MQLQAENFKPNEANEIICNYSFKPADLYHIKDI